MGIVDVRNALSNSAGDQFTFQNVKLGYGSGGRQQILSFKVICKNPDIDVDKFQEIVFSGQINPIEKAIEIGMAFKRQLNNA